MTNPDRDPSFRQSSPYKFKEAFRDLSRPDSPRPLDPARLDRSQFRKFFLEHNYYVAAVESNPELLGSLNQPKFRSLLSGRGPAVATFMDGPNFYTKFKSASEIRDDPDRQSALYNLLIHSRIGVYRAWAQTVSFGLPPLESGTDYSRRRGLEQFLTDTFAFGLNAISATDFARVVNWRLAKGLISPLETKKINNPKEFTYQDNLRLNSLYRDWGVPEPSDPRRTPYEKMSRIPLSSPSEVLVLLETLGTVNNPDNIPVIFPQINSLSPQVLLGNDFQPSRLS